jgi:type II secretory pathway predicted ATPase ExeA
MKPSELYVQLNSEKVKLAPKTQEFLEFSLRDTVLYHSRYQLALSSIAHLHHQCQSGTNTGGLLILGNSGVGKSTLIREYAQYFPAEKIAGQTKIPVLVVTCPSSATASGFLSAVFEKLGYPIPRSDIADKTLKVIKLLKIYQVEVLIIDEAQHAFYSRAISDFRQLVDTLKVVLTETNVGSVLCGLFELEEVIASNEQLARRHTNKIDFPHFTLEVESDFLEFRAILKGFEHHLPLPVETVLHEANLARRFLIASDGNLDYLRRILEKSVHLAAVTNQSLLTLEHYQAAFREYIWQQCPDKLNPFHEQSPLRRLNREGEPYYPWHQKHKIGSPLARRNLTPKGDFNGNPFK